MTIGPIRAGSFLPQSSGLISIQPGKHMSSYILRNKTTRPQSALGITIDPLAQRDICFKTSVSQLQILEALSAPEGELYIKTQAGILELVSENMPVVTQATLTATTSPSSSVTNIKEFDDFISENFAGNSNWTSGGTGGVVVAAVGGTSSVLSGGACGVVGLSTQAVTSGNVYYRKSAVAMPLGFGTTYVEMRAWLTSSAPDVTNAWDCRIGMGNATTGSLPTLGVHMKYDFAISSDWIIESIFEGVTTTISTGIPVVLGTWHKFAFDIDAAGNSVAVIFNGTTLTTFNTTAVTKTENSVRWGPYLQLNKTAGNTARSMFIDYCLINRTVSR